MTELVAAFERGEPPEPFDHRAHLQVCWAYVRDLGVLHTLARLPDRLQALASAAGKPEMYHHTVTWGFVLLVAERTGSEATFEDFVAANPDLLDKQVLRAYWSMSALERGRGAWVAPDRPVSAHDVP